jgi:hypothetical protein
MTAQGLLSVAVAGLMVTACSSGSSDAARPADAAHTAHTAHSADDTAAHAEATCHAELAELDRRDGAGAIDWEAIEGSDEEPTEQELESVMVEREPPPGEVVAGGERPTFPDFPDRLDVARLNDVELVEAVDTCYEIGLLADEDPADDEAG